VFDDAEFRGLGHGNPARAIRRKIREAQLRRERDSEWTPERRAAALEAERRKWDFMCS